MTSTPGFAATAGLLALFANGCVVFDPSLLESADTDPDHAGEDDHHAEGGEAVELAGECAEPADLPHLLSEAGHRVGSTASFGDNLRGYTGCGSDKSYAGSDGFFALDVAAGERWHIAVSPQDPELDVATVIQRGCDAATCDELMDRCGPGQAEEITIVGKTAGTVVVVVDSPGSGQGGDVEITALTTKCGDGDTEHGEACDDGNLEPLDGCDASCRVEIGDGTSPEAEPNNWHTEGNILTNPDGTTITGTIGGLCDTDHFIFTVPEGKTLTASMMTGAHLPCGADAPAIMMNLMQPSTGTKRGSGIPDRTGGSCPSIEVGDAFNEALPEGEYHLVIGTPPESSSFTYSLAFALQDAT